MNNSDKVYLKMLQDEEKKIQKKIGSNQLKNHGIIGATGIPNKKIEELKVRKNNVSDEIEAFDGIDSINRISGHFVEKLDEKADANNKKIKDISKKIDELQEMKDNLSTIKRKTKISKKIEAKQKIIGKLQKANTKIDKKQRVFMMPKKIRDMYRLKLLSKAESRVKVLKDNIKYNKQLQSMLEPVDTLKDEFLYFTYYNKCRFYKWRLKHAKEVLETVQNANLTIAMKAAAPITLSKNTVDKLRKRIKNKQDSNGRTM